MRGVLLLLLIVLSSGCVTTGYRNAVDGFATATKGVAEAVRLQVAAADVQAREQAVWAGYGGFEPDAMAELKGPSLRELRATARFTDEQRKVRTDTLNVLTRYGGLLGRLAQSEVPEDAGAASTELLGALQEIGSAGAAKITGDSDADAGLVAFAGAANSLFGEVLEAILKVAIREALDTAIRGGGDGIVQLADAMERDLVALHADRKAWLSERLIVLNTALQQTVAAARTDPTALEHVLELTQKVVAADDALKLWSLVQPEAAPNLLRTAHRELRAYVEGGHKVEALTAAGVAIYELGNEAYTLLAAVRASAPAVLEGE